MNEQLNNEPIISVRGLTKSFGKTKVIHGIDLDIMGGEMNKNFVRVKL